MYCQIQGAVLLYIHQKKTEEKQKEKSFNS